MKLHATITNENHATVSKGGNERLTVGLNVGNKNIATLELSENTIKIWHNDGHYWSTDITGKTLQDYNRDDCTYKSKDGAYCTTHNITH